MGELNDLFKRSVPVAPSTDGWVAQVRRKRRLRNGVVGGMATLVVAVAVPVTLTFSGGGEILVASPEPIPVPSMTVSSPRESTPTGVVARCPVTFVQEVIEVSAETVDGGYACTAEGGAQIRNMELRESLAMQVAAEALADAEPVGWPVEETPGGGVERTLVLRTASGDQLQLELRGDGYEFSHAGERLRWTPSPEFAAELEALFAQ